MKLILECIYQRDAFSVASEAYPAFNNLLNFHIGTSETMKDYESRFAAQMAKFNSIILVTKLPGCIKALMILKNSAIE